MGSKKEVRLRKWLADVFGQSDKKTKKRLDKNVSDAEKKLEKRQRETHRKQRSAT